MDGDTALFASRTNYSARGHPDVGEKMCSCSPTQDQCIQHQDGCQTLCALLPEPHAFDLEPASLRKLAPAPSLPFLLEYFNRRLLQEFRRRPGVHIEVVLDVAVAEHEIFADLDTLHVLRTQARHHVDVLDALVRVLGVKIERLPVEDVRRGALVLVGPASRP